MPFEEDLEYSWRCWKAEEENARRLTSRVRIASTVVFGAIGAIVFQGITAVGSGKVSLKGLNTCTVFLLGAGFVLLLAAAGFILDLFRLRRADSGASALLRLSKEERESRRSVLLALLDGKEGSREQQRQGVADAFRMQQSVKVRDAAFKLSQRNDGEKSRLARAQALLLLGLLLVAASGCLWAYNESAGKETRSDEPKRSARAPRASGETPYWQGDHRCRLLKAAEVAQESDLRC